MTPSAPSSSAPPATAHPTTSWSGGLGACATPPDLAAEVCRDLAPGPDGCLRVLDPACGEGALLLAALDGARQLGSLERVELHGIEADAGAAARARDRLERSLAEHGPFPPSGAAVHIRCDDALDPRRGWPARARVVANPPWVSFSGRQAASAPPEALERLRRDYAAFAGWPALHGAFLERIARYVDEHDTTAAVLVPASLCSLDRYAAARRAAEQWAELAGPPESVPERAFPGATGPAALLRLRARASGGGAAWSPRSAEIERLCARLAAFPRLPPACFADPGVHTGNCAAALVRRSSGATPPGANLREGRDLREFELGAPRASLRTDLSPTAANRFRVHALERYRSYPLLVRQTADRPVAALHEAPTYFRNSLLACRPPDGVDPAYAVAVLNGLVARAWHRASFADARQRAFPQVKVAHLRSQPFPILPGDSRMRREIAARARALQASTRKAGPGARGRGDDRARLDELVLASFGLEPDLIGIVREQSGDGATRTASSNAVREVEDCV